MNIGQWYVYRPGTDHQVLSRKVRGRKEERNNTLSRIELRSARQHRPSNLFRLLLSIDDQRAREAVSARSIRFEYLVGVVVARWRTPTKPRQRGHGRIGVRAGVGLLADAR